MWMLCAVVLAQASLPPPSPPPLVPLDAPVGTEAAPPPPPPPDAASSATAPAPSAETTPGVSAQEQGFNGRRVGITGAVVGGVTLLGLTGLVVGINSCSSTDGSCQAALGLGGLPVLFLATSFAGYWLHRTQDGLGSFGAAVGGVGIGAGVSAVSWFLASTVFNGHIPAGAQVALVVTNGVFVGLATALMTELSHVRTLAERNERFHITVLPTRGGAMVGLGGSF